MNIEFKLPELGENIASGDVVRVLVREGDVIAANDGVVELETEKAVVEIPARMPARSPSSTWPRGKRSRSVKPLLTIEAEGRREQPSQQGRKAEGGGRK